jgi:AraC-like DNA-binding protein
LTIIDCQHSLDGLKGFFQNGFKRNRVIAYIGSNLALRQRVYLLGASDYLTSPVITQELVARVKNSYCDKIKVLADGPAKAEQLCSCLDIPQHQNKGDQHREHQYKLVQDTCDYLLANLPQDHALDSLASQMATNRNTLSTSFKNVMGTSVFAWLRVQRMKKAQALLKTTKMSIQHICYEVGYHNPANFSTSFKTTFNLSPQEFRNQ